MGQTADQIETHIERTRDNLGSNITELEQKVKSATDWKHYFRNNPMTMMGVAFGGGVLLAVMLGNGRRHRARTFYFEDWDRHLSRPRFEVFLTRSTSGRSLGFNSSRSNRFMLGICRWLVPILLSLWHNDRQPFAQ